VLIGITINECALVGANFAAADGIALRRDSLSWTELGFAGLRISAVLVSLLLFSQWP
jgi:hypothetical protein